MRILAIETSCDETAVAILEVKGGIKNISVKILGNALLSQIETHKPLGGVVPNLARREHEHNLIPIMLKALSEAKLIKDYSKIHSLDKKLSKKIEKILVRERTLQSNFLPSLGNIRAPKIDAIAVTVGPGLEPALWVGINFARALGALWDIPIIPINHMEGHIVASLLNAEGTRKGRGLNAEVSSYTLNYPKLPLLALLISGGHTELVLMKKWLQYKIIGETQDDAVGEAFDKVARMLNLPYPGGPQISLLAERARNEAEQTRKVAEKKSSVSDLRSSASSPQSSAINLPRPMLHSPDCNFSFAGLKTAVLYSLQKNRGGNQKSLSFDISNDKKMEYAREFEDAVTDVLLAKTKKAIKQTGAKTLVLGGGVSANRHIRRVFTEEVEKSFGDIKLLIPNQTLTTDNAVMIGLSAYMRAKSKKKILKASGNLRLGL